MKKESKVKEKKQSSKLTKEQKQTQKGSVRVVASNVQKLMAINTISQQNLSKKSGLSKKFLSQLLNDKVDNLKLSTIHQLCDGLECDINELF